MERRKEGGIEKEGGSEGETKRERVGKREGGEVHVYYINIIINKIINYHWERSHTQKNKNIQNTHIQQTTWCYQATVVHGDTSTKHCSIIIKNKDTTSFHLCIEQCDSSPYVAKERISTIECDRESESCYSTGIFSVS